MDEIMQQALNKMIEEVTGLENELKKNPLFEEIRKKKMLINQFSQNYGGDTVFKDIDAGEAFNKGYLNIKKGQFKGRPFTKAVREYLEMRGKENPAPLAEIEEALQKGDFDFSKVKDVRSALVKNNYHFTLLSDDYFGLSEWYYSGKKKKNKAGQETEETDDNDDNNENEKAVEEGSTA